VLSLAAVNQLNAIVEHILGSSDNSAGVLATLVTVVGSSYRRPGARMLLTSAGVRLGSISGGCLEEDVIARARVVATTGVPEVITYDTTSENDLVWGVGLGCHGVVQVLLEKLPARPAWASVLQENFRTRRATSLKVVWRAHNPTLLGTHLRLEAALLGNISGVFEQTIPPAVSLVIFGAGDDAQPLVRLAKEIGWHVTIADPRGEFATTLRFPTADVILVRPASELMTVLAPPSDAIAVVMTHHYVHDLPILRDLLVRKLPYIGLLGPKKRAERILADLRSQGNVFAPAQLEHLHAPVGLDIGGETPEEVALSIVAEINSTLAGRDARPLRERERPIHEVFAPQKPNLSS